MKRKLFLIVGFLTLLLSVKLYGDSASSFWQKYFPIIDAHFDEYQKLLSKNRYHVIWLMFYRGDEFAGGVPVESRGAGFNPEKSLSSHN